MAKVVKITITDDLTGGDADETVSFGLDGRAYDIDLSEKNASTLRKSLERYIGAARSAKLPRRSRQSPAASHASDGAVDPKAVRAWASKNGIDVSARGRIPATVIEKYLAR